MLRKVFGEPRMDANKRECFSLPAPQAKVTTDERKCTQIKKNISVFICVHLWSKISGITCGASLDKIRVYSRPFAVSFSGDF
jgi:hypothetical protein